MKHAWLISAMLCAAAFAEPTVPDLVKQLESGTWSERESAEDALASMGESARAPIREALKTTNDIEARERLQSALSRIDRNQMLEATTVKLTGTFERPYDAFAKVAEQMGLKLQTENDNAMARATAPMRLELATERSSWIVALSDLTARTNIEVRIADDSIVLQEMPPSVVRKPMQTSGAMTVIADSARKRLMQQLSENMTSGTTTLNLSFQCEPKLRFANNRMLLKLDSLFDEAGNAVLPDVPRAMEVWGGSGGRASAGIPLGAADKLPAKLSKVVGEIEGNMIVRTSEVRIDDLSNLPVTVEIQENRIEVLSLNREGDAWVIQIKSPNGARGSVVTFGGRASALSGLSIQDAEGRSLRFSPQQLRASGDTITTPIQITPAADNSPPVRMIWTVPAQTREVRIPFELHDLEMPR